MFVQNVIQVTDQDKLAQKMKVFVKVVMTQIVVYVIKLPQNVQNVNLDFIQKMKHASHAVVYVQNVLMQLNVKSAMNQNPY